MRLPSSQGQLNDPDLHPSQPTTAHLLTVTSLTALLVLCRVRYAALYTLTARQDICSIVKVSQSCYDV
jgi:hypothetical protein